MLDPLITPTTYVIYTEEEPGSPHELSIGGIKLINIVPWVHIVWASHMATYITSIPDLFHGLSNFPPFLSAMQTLGHHEQDWRGGAYVYA